jgi:RHS repeat-associated protein
VTGTRTRMFTYVSSVSYGYLVPVNYFHRTGQRKDDTGLLYYHARYYDPSLARFVSPDSIVPGAASGVGGAGGSMGAWQNSGLTVDFHENGFVSSANSETALVLTEGFWSDERDVNGPRNPQALSRYSYVLNNPLRHIDPTGHNADRECMGCPPARNSSRPAPAPAPTPTPSGTATPTPASKAKYSDDEIAYAFAVFAAQIAQYVLEEAGEAFFERAWNRWGTNVDDWELVGTKPAELENEHRIGVER